MLKNQKNHQLVISIYTTTGFPYGMAAENFIRQVALGIKENNYYVNVIRMCGENPRNAAENDTGILVENLWIKKRLTGILSIIDIVVIPFLIPFSLLKNKFKNGTNTVIMYGVHYAYWGAPLIFWCKLFGLKIFSIETERYLRQYFGKEWWKYPRWLTYKMQFGFFDKFLNGKVCLSSFLINDSIQRGVNKNKLVLIPHFIDTDFFNQELIPNINPFTIGYSGAIYSLNGVFILINAFKSFLKKVPFTKLLLIGNVHDNEKEKINSMISEIKNSVEILGIIPAKQVPKVLSKCHILVNPREKSILSDSGFPTKIGEYMSIGKPVISSDTGDLKMYFADKREIYYFNSGDYRCLAELMMEIYTNYEKAKEIGYNGHKMAQQILNYKSSAKKMINFISKNNA